MFFPCLWFEFEVVCFVDPPNLMHKFHFAVNKGHVDFNTNEHDIQDEMNRLRSKGKMDQRSKQKREAGGTRRKDITVDAIATVPDLKLGATKQAAVDGWRRLKQSHIPTGFITKIHAPRCEVRPLARVVAGHLQESSQRI
jgi:hypothetical protein